MLPTAGLFLPETLRRQDGPTLGHSEADNARPRCFQRKPGRPKQEVRQADIETSSTGNLGSTDAIDEFPSIKTAFQFADLVSTSVKVSSESHALAFLIHRVQHDTVEAARLHLSAAVTNFLEAWPDRKLWIDTILIDVRRALNDIGTHMDTFWVAGNEGGAIGLKRKLEWISGHQKRLQSKQQVLSACHQNLVTAINIMQTVELCGVTNGTLQDPIYEAPVQPWVKNDNAQVLRGPYSRREYRMSQKNLSLSSMHLSQAKEENLETQSVNSIPAELSGSIPDDLANPSNASDPSSPRICNTYRRSLNRQTYFNSHANQSVTHTMLNDASVTQMERLQIHSHENLSTTRNSLDNFSGPHSTMLGNWRASLNSARPLSLPEQLQTTITPDFEPRTTADIVRPRPTLTEKVIERNDSTTSTTAVVAVPQVAIRYSPNPVYIKRHAGRHRSLPSELPHLQGQSSLTEDLADWMIFPIVESEKPQSVKWDAGSASKSSSMSFVSCPAVTQVTIPATRSDASSPENPKTESSPTSNLDYDRRLTNQDDNDNAQDTATSIKSESQPSSAGERERAESIRSTSSNVTRKPLPVSSTINASIIDPALALSGDFKSKPSSLNPQPKRALGSNGSGDTQADEHLSKSPAAMTYPDTAHLSSPTTTIVSVPTSEDAELSLLQQKLLRQTYVESVNKSSSIDTKPLPISQAPLHSIPDVSSRQTEIEVNSSPTTTKQAPTRPPEPASPPSTTKPMSAQAKRRAAHQRRMEIAFGRLGGEG